MPKVYDNKTIEFQNGNKGTKLRVITLGNLPAELIDRISRQNASIPKEHIGNVIVAETEMSREDYRAVLKEMATLQRKIAQMRYPKLFGSKKRVHLISEIASKCGINCDRVNQKLKEIDGMLGLSQVQVSQN